MGHQLQHHHLPAGREDARRLAEHRRRIVHVVEALGEHDQPGLARTEARGGAGPRGGRSTLPSPSRFARARAWARAARLWSMATTERAQRAMEALSTPVPQPKSATSSAGRSEASAPGPEEPGLARLEQPLVEELAVLALAEEVLEPGEVSGGSSTSQAILISGSLHVPGVHRERVVGEAGGALLADQPQLPELAQVVAHRGLRRTQRRRPARRRSGVPPPTGGGCGAGWGRRAPGRTGREPPYQWVFICPMGRRRQGQGGPPRRGSVR